MQKALVDKIHRRGFQVILTDANEQCFVRSSVDEFVHLDIFDLEGNARAAERLSEKFDIKAAMTASADSIEGPAVVAHTLGLHGVSPETARLFRYKHLSRELLTKAGVPQPRFGTASEVDVARKLATSFGLPVCLKATNNSGSRGFSVIRSLDQLTESAFDHARKNGTSGLVIVEELLEPVEDELSEQSLETVWYEGKMYWLNWTDRMFRQDMRLFPGVDSTQYEKLPWAVEIGHLNPALHSYDTTRKVQEMAEACGRALGLGTARGGHIMKADIMLTKKGPYILEPTLRLSGGWDSGGSSVMRGADFHEGAISLALGEPLTLDLWHDSFQYKNPYLHVAVMSEIPDNPIDCIGRRFALAGNFNRERAVLEAEKLVREKKFVV